MSEKDQFKYKTIYKQKNLQHKNNSVWLFKFAFKIIFSV